MQGVLKAIKGGEALRDETVRGTYNESPTPGRRFALYGPPRAIDVGYRRVLTSLVQRIIDQDEHRTVFETENSVYELQHR